MTQWLPLDSAVSLSKATMHLDIPRSALHFCLEIPEDLSLGCALCWAARVAHTKRPGCSILHLDGVSAWLGA